MTKNSLKPITPISGILVILQVVRWELRTGLAPGHYRSSISCPTRQEEGIPMKRLFAGLLDMKKMVAHDMMQSAKNKGECAAHLRL